MPFVSPLWWRGPHAVWLHHVHGPMWNMALGDRLGKVGRLLEERVAPPLYRRVPVVTLSASSEEELTRDLGFSQDRVGVVEPGIDARYTPGGTRSETPLVVAVARLAPVKRFSMLVRAAARARERVGDLRLVIVGEGYMRPDVVATIEAVGGQSWVHMAGHVSDDELKAAATDGHRLARFTIARPDGAEGMPDVIVPRKCVAELRKLLEEALDTNVEIDLSASKIRFTLGGENGVVLTSKLIDGTFPDYSRVIPTGNDKLLRLDPRSFYEGVDLSLIHI